MFSDVSLWTGIKGNRPQIPQIAQLICTINWRNLRNLRPILFRHTRVRAARLDPAEKQDRYKARMLAGYCWDWISQKQPSLPHITIGDYSATWNLLAPGQAWPVQPDSVNEVGCIHTCQGLELD